MQYIIHFMFFCFSYSYLTDIPLLSYRRDNLPKNNKIHSDTDESSENSDTSDMAIEINDLGSHNNNQVYQKNEREAKNIRRQGPEVLNKNSPQILRKGVLSLRSFSDSSDRDHSTFDFQGKYKKDWAQLQLEVLNMSVPDGDDVFMVAARPWGIPCGDPNQHDVPWGSCMLPMECDPDYRVPRGDYFCGRTSFICCALLDNAYDFNMPFDASFGDSEFAENSDEIRFKILHGDEAKQLAEDKLRAQDRKTRKEERTKRKKTIEDLRKDIAKQLKELLDKAYANNTKMKYKKKKQMTLFLKDLKNQYKKDRQAVKDIHEVNVIRLDKALRDKLDQLMQVQRDFVTNPAFREIVLKAKETMTMPRSDAMLLMQAFPELQPYFIKRRDNKDKKGFLPYDIEYGLMYY